MSNITFCLISICPLTFTDLQCFVERVRFSAAVNVQNGSEHCVELLTFQLVGLFNTRCQSNMTSFNRLLQVRLYYSAYSVTYDDMMIVCFQKRQNHNIKKRIWNKSIKCVSHDEMQYLVLLYQHS